MPARCIRCLLLAFAIVAVGSCSQSTRRDLDECADGGCEAGDGDGDGDLDAAPDGGGPRWCTFAEMDHPRTHQVDILFVIDDTGDMAEEQSVLAEQAEIMLREMLEPIEPEASPIVDDLHIGVVTTNMGSGPYELWGCASPDEGVLQNVGRPAGCRDEYSASDCARSTCPWLAHSPEHPDDGSDPSDPPIWEDFGCIATLGTGGCGFEQPLEASYSAMVEQTLPGRPNEGFLREDSVVAVIYVTTEDDCSASDTDIFDPDRDDFGPFNLRCALNPDRLHPVERYYDALRGLRPGREDLVAVAAVVGVPIDGSWNPGDPLERLWDLQQPDPSNPNELLRSCDTALGGAWPPVRLVELVYAFGRNGVLESICRSDWTPAFQAVTRTILSRLTGSCLAADVDAATLATCRLIETLRDDRACPHLADGSGSERTSGWQVDLGVDADGRRRCQILRADYDGDGCPDGDCDCEGDVYDPNPYAGCLQGWFYRSVNPPCEHGRLELTRRSVAGTGSELELECFTERCPSR